MIDISILLYSVEHDTGCIDDKVTYYFIINKRPICTMLYIGAGRNYVDYDMLLIEACQYACLIYMQGGVNNG